MTVRNDPRRRSADAWVFAGDLVYAHENLRGTDPADPQYVPVGLATGSQFTLIMTSEKMVTRVGGDPHRVMPVHEEAPEGSVPVADCQDRSADHGAGVGGRRNEPGMNCTIAELPACESRNVSQFCKSADSSTGRLHDRESRAHHRLHSGAWTGCRRSSSRRPAATSCSTDSRIRRLAASAGS